MNELTPRDILFLCAIDGFLIHLSVSGFKKIFKTLGDIEEYAVKNSCWKLLVRFIFLCISSALALGVGGRIIYWILKHINFT